MARLSTTTSSTTATASIIYRTPRFIDITNINSLITATSSISYGFNIIQPLRAFRRTNIREHCK